MKIICRAWNQALNIPQSAVSVR